jgi:hypothetical protein
LQPWPSTQTSTPSCRSCQSSASDDFISPSQASSAEPPTPTAAATSASSPHTLAPAHHVHSWIHCDFRQCGRCNGYNQMVCFEYYSETRTGCGAVWCLDCRGTPPDYGPAKRALTGAQAAAASAASAISPPAEAKVPQHKHDWAWHDEECRYCGWNNVMICRSCRRTWCHDCAGPPPDRQPATQSAEAEKTREALCVSRASSCDAVKSAASRRRKDAMGRHGQRHRRATGAYECMSAL